MLFQDMRACFEAHQMNFKNVKKWFHGKIIFGAQMGSKHCSRGAFWTRMTDVTHSDPPKVDIWRWSTRPHWRASKAWSNEPILVHIGLWEVGVMMAPSWCWSWFPIFPILALQTNLATQIFVLWKKEGHHHEWFEKTILIDLSILKFGPVVHELDFHGTDSTESSKVLI